jgi:hypothetical protein
MATRESKKTAAKPKTRLRLSKETIRDLDASEKRDVKGGLSSKLSPSSRSLPKSAYYPGPLTGMC